MWPKYVETLVESALEVPEAQEYLSLERKRIMAENKITYSCHFAVRTDKDGNSIFCGADLTDLIEAIPADGNDHDVECPKCHHISHNSKSIPAE